MAEYYRKKQPSCITPDGREWFASGGGTTNPEYIEREAVLKMQYWEGSGHIRYGVVDVADIENIPAADVVPVVHGRWKYFYKQGKAVCTNCSFERGVDDNFGRAVACPNCGARMDGE